MIISHFKVAENLDTSALLLALKRQPWLFGQYNLRQNSYAHSEMTDIWVRYNNAAPYIAQGDFEFINAEHDSIWYPAYYMLPQLRPLIFDLMARVEGERLGAVLITKLPPGGRIQSHVDLGWHAAYYDKYYIPLENEPGAVFSFPDGDIPAKVGEAYWFENAVPHSVQNNSDSDRLALVVCIRSDSTRGAYRPQPIPDPTDRKLAFFGGVCMLQMKVPAGCKVTQHVHPYDHLSYLVKGEVLIQIGDASTPLHRIGPCSLEVKANTAHEITALTDTVWLCLHSADEAEAKADGIDSVIVQPVGTEPIVSTAIPLP